MWVRHVCTLGCPLYFNSKAHLFDQIKNLLQTQLDGDFVGCILKMPQQRSYIGTQGTNGSRLICEKAVSSPLEQ